MQLGRWLGGFWLWRRRDQRRLASTCRAQLPGCANRLPHDMDLRAQSTREGAGGRHAESPDHSDASEEGVACTQVSMCPHEPLAYRTHVVTGMTLEYRKAS